MSQPAQLEYGDERVPADPQGTENEGNSFDRGQFAWEVLEGFRLLRTSYSIPSHAYPYWVFPPERVGLIYHKISRYHRKLPTEAT